MQVINFEEDGSNAGAEAAMAGAAEGASITATVLDSASDDSGGAEAAKHELLEVVTLTVKFAYFDTLLRSLALIHCSSVSRYSSHTTISKCALSLVEE